MTSGQRRIFQRALQQRMRWHPKEFEVGDSAERVGIVLRWISVCQTHGPEPQRRPTPAERALPLHSQGS